MNIDYRSVINLASFSVDKTELNSAVVFSIIYCCVHIIYFINYLYYNHKMCAYSIY